MNNHYMEKFKILEKKFWYAILSACFFPSIIAYITAFLFDLSGGNALSRAGSIMVVLGLWAELYAVELKSLLSPVGFSEIGQIELIKKYASGNYPKVISSIPLIPIFLGTILWGYGDLIF